MKRWLSALLAALIVMLAPAAFAEDARPANWYEVFVRSYQDSDGDGLGDLNGLAARLDYIEWMGWRGLWLMPVMPSPSYHKYDVTDYRAIDPEYGTIDDMRALVSACHARGIQLIVDLPINHTSTQHPWFQAACEVLRKGRSRGRYVSYYHFSRAPQAGYAALEGTDWYYEEQFSGGGMPDLNLDNPDVRAEIEAIMAFWLNDIGVDGFRLDAVTSYYTGDTAANVAFLGWLKQTAEALRPGSVLIGECWAGLNVIAEYCQSGVDSCFLFPASQAEGFIVKSLLARKGRAERFAAGYGAVLEAMPDAWLTPFLCNHDTGRTVGLVRGRENLPAAKFTEGVLGMLGGGVFTYYGEEIGMVGSGDDPNKRLAMYWADGDMTAQPPGVTREEYAYPPVQAQREDPDSLLNYVRAVNQTRLDFPAISAGRNTFLLAEGDVCLMRREAADETVFIAINFDPKQPARVSVGPCAIAADLETGAEAASIDADGETLLLPPYGIAVLVPGET